MAARVDLTRIHPLNFPEIRTIIVSCLSINRINLHACSLVSKAWLQTCLPFIWDTLDLCKFQDAQLSLIRQGIEKNGHLIRNVTLEHMRFNFSHPHLQKYILPFCKRLERIELMETLAKGVENLGTSDLNKYQLRLDEWADIAALIRQNPELKDFRIENTNVWTPPLGFWNALAVNAPKLRSLHILRATIGVDNSFNNGNSSSSDRHEGHEIIDSFLDISLDAPKLKELIWGSPHQAIELPVIIAPFLTIQITKRQLALDSLDLSEEMPFEDPELQAILMSLSRPLLSLRVKDSEFAALSLAAFLEPWMSWLRWQSSPSRESGLMTSGTHHRI
ncbi:hypothetical protein FBU30_007285 [Linnemannia zychae]|nr:hypothetical protein FBU30_007285 [Linnemannia zychae]